MDDLKIGSKVYVFDESYRVYRRDGNGRAIGGAIYREHFREVEITGETPRKWKAGYNEAFKKNPYETGFLTREMVEERVWDKEHRYEISSAVSHKATTKQLMEIADILGFGKDKQ